ncbi:UNVERIFIED_CONTAM: hypothetical protein NCL1_19580 [Trichonephila clavipes]
MNLDTLPRKSNRSLRSLLIVPTVTTEAPRQRGFDVTASQCTK